MTALVLLRESGSTVRAALVAFLVAIVLSRALWLEREMGNERRHLRHVSLEGILSHVTVDDLCFVSPWEMAVFH
jgi:hypothetical protein